MLGKRQIAKLITSTIVLMSLGIIVLIGKKQPLIAHKKNSDLVFSSGNDSRLYECE